MGQVLLEVVVGVVAHTLDKNKLFKGIINSIPATKKALTWWSGVLLNVQDNRLRLWLRWCWCWCWW